MSRSSTVKVLDKALTIVDQLTDVAGECSMSDLSRSTALPISTAYRILATLEHHGYVQRNPSTKRYAGGPKIVSARANTDQFRELADAALPAMAQLGRTTNETVLLSRLNATRDRSICVARVESPLPLRLELLPGTLTPLYLGALQLVLLAFLDPVEIQQLLSKPLRPVTRKTIVNPVRLKRRLSRIRNTGYVRISEETALGVAGLAVPLFDQTGRISLSLGIAGPSNRLAAASVRSYLSAIHSAATEIARRLDLRTWERRLWLGADSE